MINVDPRFTRQPHSDEYRSEEKDPEVSHRGTESQSRKLTEFSFFGLRTIIFSFRSVILCLCVRSS
jgi:hypothetical protein